MKIGTKSVLFGAHAFWLHPWFVALAWWKLYGFPWDPRLWVAFFVHDLGYWGKPNMDGEEGETHPEWGARVMTALFDAWTFPGRARRTAPDGSETPWLGRWGQFVYFHSRFLSKRFGAPFSRLCVADKLAVALEPWWLYLPRVIATGEIKEYMALADARTTTDAPKYASMNVFSDDRRQWFTNVQEYLRRWVEEHRDGREDTWTPSGRVAANATGVWK